MQPHDLEMVALIKQVGAERVQELLDLYKAFQGDEKSAGPRLALSKKRTLSLVKLGNAVQAEVPKGQRGRRKGDVDPNSVRQRVFRAVREILEENDSLPTSQVLLQLEERTGLDPARCKQNAFQVPGVIRQYGTWKLAA